MYIWEKHLDYSEYLLKNSHQINKQFEETIFRTIIHNDYYACFHKIKELNEVYNLITPDGGNNSHNNIIIKVREYDVELSLREKNSIIQRVNLLKDYRRKADYERGNDFLYTETMVTMIHEQAKEVFKQLNSLWVKD